MNNLSLIIIILMTISSQALSSGFITEFSRLRPFSAEHSLGADRKGSAKVAFGFSAENILRTRTGGKLTAEVSTSASSQSVFFPLKIAEKPTGVSFCRTTSGANLFYDHENKGANLYLNADSYNWSLSQDFRRDSLRVTGTHYSGRCAGTSTYPQSFFKMFTAAAQTRIALDQHTIAFELVHSLGSNTDITIKLGGGDWNTFLSFAQNNTNLSIPVNLDMHSFGFATTRRINPKLSCRLGYDWSNGSSSSVMSKGSKRIGKLQSQPSYSGSDIALCYCPNLRTTWEAGHVSSRQTLHLRGYNIDGDELGLKFEPFNDKVDFASNMSLKTGLYHLGFNRQISKRWSFGARYKLMDVDSSVRGDYVGRGFLGLISASGVFDSTLLDAKIHGLELTADCASGPFITTLRMEQLVPQSSSNHEDQPSDPRPSIKSRSTGGTSFSLLTTYAY